MLASWNSYSFREGQTVKDGDLLAEIDPRPFEVQLTQAEGQMARDQALLKNALVDLDQGAMSRQLVRMIGAHELVRVSAAPSSLANAERSARSGEVGGIIVIPEGFERKIRRGERASVAAYADASYFLIYRQVLTGALEATGTLSAGIENSTAETIQLKRFSPMNGATAFAGERIGERYSVLDGNGGGAKTFVSHEAGTRLSLNNLLIEPEMGVAISLDECKELAKDPTYVGDVLREGARRVRPIAAATADVVIVGGGVMGTSIALQLARRRAGRLVVDGPRGF